MALQGNWTMGEVHQLVATEAFSLQAAGHLVTKIFAPWVQDLAQNAEGEMVEFEPREGAVIFTDDRAPIEAMTRRMLEYKK